MESSYIPAWAENWNARFGIDVPLFPTGVNRVYSADAQFFLKAVLIIRIDSILFTAKTAAKGQPNAARGQIKQIGRVNIRVECGEFGGENVPRSVRRKIDQWLVGCDRYPEVIERIIRRCLPDIIRRDWIKERVIRIQDSLEARPIDAFGSAKSAGFGCTRTPNRSPSFRQTACRLLRQP